MALLTIKQKILIQEIKKTGISKDKLIDLFEKTEDQGDGGSAANLSLHQILDLHEKEFQKLNTVKQVTITSQLFKLRPNEDQRKLPSNKQILENVQEFMKKDEYLIWNEIKDFVNKYNIRHVIIAEMTKIVPESISKYLRGYPSYISSRAKLRLYTWYSICKDRPEITSEWYPPLDSNNPRSKERGSSKKGRFIYRKEHLEVLHKYFNINRYPDKETKEKIANECNLAVELKGNFLNYGEKVNKYMVNSWFGNKRREAKLIKLKE